MAVQHRVSHACLLYACPPTPYFLVTVCVRSFWTPSLSQSTLTKLPKLLQCSGDIREMRSILHISISILHFYIFMTMD